MQKKKKSELLQVLDYYGLLRTADVDEKFKILCPFHGDAKPSLQINLDSDTFYCYGCMAKGEAKDFVKMMEECDDLRAYIKLEKIKGGLVGKKYKVNGIVKLSYEEELESARQFFYSLPRPSWQFVKESYMHDRGFNSKTLKKADVRINPNPYYGIIAPLLDMGRFKGYVCRATQGGIDKKYLYNKGFSRRNSVIGYYDSDFVVIVEGYMDWLKMQQFGIHNSCAILGWKATDEQIKKLKQYTNYVISALDNTETGEKGTKYLEKFFKVVRFQFPENVKDPGDMDEVDFTKAWLDTYDLVKRLKPNIRKDSWR